MTSARCACDNPSATVSFFFCLLVIITLVCWVVARLQEKKYLTTMVIGTTSPWFWGTLLKKYIYSDRSVFWTHIKLFHSFQRPNYKITSKNPPCPKRLSHNSTSHFLFSSAAMPSLTTGKAKLAHECRLPRQVDMHCKCRKWRSMGAATTVGRCMQYTVGTANS